MVKQWISSRSMVVVTGLIREKKVAAFQNAGIILGTEDWKMMKL